MLLVFSSIAFSFKEYKAEHLCTSESFIHCHCNTMANKFHYLLQTRG